MQRRPFLFPLRFSLIKDPFGADLHTIHAGQGQLLNKGKDVGKGEWRCCHRGDSYNKQLPSSQRVSTLLLVIETYANRKNAQLSWKNMAPCVRVSADEGGINVFNREICLVFFLCIVINTLLHLTPLRFHCVGGCWDRTQGCCDLGIGSQTL